MMGQYPNLELLEYKAKLIIENEDSFRGKIWQKKAEFKYFCFDFSVDVFQQVWGSTCTAFDVTKNGEPAIGGSAMTHAYTVVFYESMLDIYIVFVDNKFCYFVENANEEFLSDLKNRNLKPLSEAMKVY